MDLPEAKRSRINLAALTLISSTLVVFVVFTGVYAQAEIRFNLWNATNNALDDWLSAPNATTITDAGIASAEPRELNLSQLTLPSTILKVLTLWCWLGQVWQQTRGCSVVEPSRTRFLCFTGSASLWIVSDWMYFFMVLAYSPISCPFPGPTPLSWVTFLSFPAQMVVGTMLMCYFLPSWRELFCFFTRDAAHARHIQAVGEDDDAEPQRRRIMLVREVTFGQLEDVHDRDKAVTCALCLEPFKRTDPLLMLACSHYFHRDCANELLAADAEPGAEADALHPRCPICRAWLEHDFPDAV